MSTQQQRPEVFLEHRPALSVDFNETDGDRPGWLREAQAGAYWAVRAHFTTSARPALVSLPTGSGKTALMSLLAFGVGRRRVLAVAPAVVVRDQIADEFRHLEVIRKTGAFGEDEAPDLAVHVLRHRPTSAAEWRALAAHDIVVSTPGCLTFKGSKPPESVTGSGLFDTVFFDEAHHLAAATWRRLLALFDGARIVGFTATPFRLDRKPLPGSIVYSYPLARALAKGIYAPVDLIQVSGEGNRDAQTERLAKKAAETLERHARKGPAKMLVRVGRIDDCEKIQGVYAGLGLDLEVVNSSLSLRTNKKALERAENDETCHGLICVGMLSEGLDLPVLRIGVLHEPQQSFPFTLQFIGRLCRVTSPEQGRSKLLVIPDQVEEHTKGLYDLNAVWEKLIPKLADGAVGEERKRRRFSREAAEDPEQEPSVALHSLHPFLVTTIHRLPLGEGDLRKPPKLPRHIEVVESFRARDLRWRVLITRTRAKPEWTTSDVLLNRIYDLFIYYRKENRERREALLFEAATSDRISARILASFGIRRRPIAPDRIEQVISQGGAEEYYSLGLNKVTMSSPSIPEYKMMAGRKTECAVREQDARFFTVGNLFGRIGWNGDSRPLGIASGRSRVWATERKYVNEFIDWCDRIAERLNVDTFLPLPYLGHLRKGQSIGSFPARPCAVVMPSPFWRHLQEGLRLEVEGSGDTRSYDGESVIDLTVDPYSWNKARPESCRLALALDGSELAIRYSLQRAVRAVRGRPYSTPRFQLVPAADVTGCLVKLDAGRGRLASTTLAEYLEQFPPTVFLEDGSSVVGGTWYPFDPPPIVLPERAFDVEDWGRVALPSDAGDARPCLITVEDRAMVGEKRRKTLEKENALTVLEAAARLLPAHLTEDAVLFMDHHSGEIADYLALEPDGPAGLHVHLFHCKASQSATPGGRLHDAYEVLGQVRKSLRFLRDPALFRTMGERLTMNVQAHGRKKALILGSKKELEELARRVTPQRARYTVHAVQPGFDLDKIRFGADDSLRLLLLALYDDLRQDGVEFHVIGSGTDRLAEPPVPPRVAAEEPAAAPA